MSLLLCFFPFLQIKTTFFCLNFLGLVKAKSVCFTEVKIKILKKKKQQNFIYWDIILSCCHFEGWLSTLMLLIRPIDKKVTCDLI